MSHYLSKTDLELAARLILACLCVAACWDTSHRCSFFFEHDAVTPTGVMTAHVIWPLCYLLRELGKHLQQSVDEFQWLYHVLLP